MRNALPKDIPECLKRQYPRFTTIKASLVIALGIVYIVFSQVYHHDSFGVRAAFFASYIIVIIWAFLPVMMGDRGLKRLVRRAVDEQFEMCCACGYSIPPGARVCPECGEAWDPHQAHRSWESAARRLCIGGYSRRRRRDSAS